MKTIFSNLCITIIIALSVPFITGCGLGFDDSDDSNNMVQLEAPSNYAYGAGTFGNPAVHLKNENGEALTEGTDCVYGSPLNSGDYNIYDNGYDGDFETGRYFRIVENKDNITNELGLTPVAMDLSTDISPSREYVYIDPVQGKFVMPRPAYMRLNGYVDSVINPLIGGIVTSDKNWIHNYNAVAIHINKEIKTQNFIIVHKNEWPKKGTISTWLYHSVGGNFQGDASIAIGNSKVIEVKRDSRLGDNNSNARIQVTVLNSGTTQSSTIERYTYNHIYLIWDADGTDIDIVSGKTWEVFVNGDSLASGSDDIASVLSNQLNEYGWGENTDSNSHAISRSKDFKYWEEVVDPSPKWIYEFEIIGGDDHRFPLHKIYGSANNYQPVLTGNRNGVGYFK
ncbi:MAG: hypothetical protein GY754_31265 [bacterium]|nr:hypothetical protein [bacterium]